MRRLATTFCLVAACAASAAQTSAAERAVTLRKPAALRKGIAAMPEIASPQDDAERAINTAVARLDRSLVQRLQRCLLEDGRTGYWTRTVDVTMRGPRFLSYVVQDAAFCGGAHPNAHLESIVYDLRTGKPIDWTEFLPITLAGTLGLEEDIDETKMITLSSSRLYELYRQGYTTTVPDVPGEESCKQAMDEFAENAATPPPMMAWLDARSASLVIRFDLPHVIQACATPVYLGVPALRQEGVSDSLIAALDHAARTDVQRVRMP